MKNAELGRFLQNNWMKQFYDTAFSSSSICVEHIADWLFQLGWGFTKLLTQIPKIFCNFEP